MNQQQDMTADQFRINHLTQRCAEIVADYEGKMAVGALQVTMLSQERDSAVAQVQTLQAEVAELRELLEDRDDKPND